MWVNNIVTAQQGSFQKKIAWDQTWARSWEKNEGNNEGHELVPGLGFDDEQCPQGATAGLPPEEPLRNQGVGHRPPDVVEEAEGVRTVQRQNGRMTNWQRSKDRTSYLIPPNENRFEHAKIWKENGITNSLGLPKKPLARGYCGERQKCQRRNHGSTWVLELCGRSSSETGTS